MFVGVQQPIGVNLDSIFVPSGKVMQPAAQQSLH